jgi:hypothetical protein
MGGFTGAIIRKRNKGEKNGVWYNKNKLNRRRREK